MEELLPLAPSGLEQIADITRKSCGIEEKESDRLEAKYLTVSPRGRTQLAISAEREGGSFGRVLIKEYLLCQYLHSSREDEQEGEAEGSAACNTLAFRESDNEVRNVPQRLKYLGIL